MSTPIAEYEASTLDDCRVVLAEIEQRLIKRAGAKRLWALMEHTTKDGRSKLVHRCSYPLTAPKVVKRVYTNYAVLDVVEVGFRVIDMAPGLSREELQAKTDAPLSYQA